MVSSEIVLSVVVLLAALMVDRLFGDPHSAYHPVALLGRFIGWWGRPELFPSAVQRCAGVVLWLITATLFTLPFYLIAKAAPWLLYLLLAPFLLKDCFAWRSLEEHTLAVVAALKDGVENGREQVKLLVSRDTARLNRIHILSAAYESMTENLTDSIISPLLFFSVFGLAGAALFRAANTMDAMLGYRDERERIGWFPARMDDMINFTRHGSRSFSFLYISVYRGRFSQGGSDNAPRWDKPPRVQRWDRDGHHGGRDTASGLRNRVFIPLVTVKALWMKAGPDILQAARSVTLMFAVCGYSDFIGIWINSTGI